MSEVYMDIKTLKLKPHDRNERLRSLLGPGEYEVFRDDAYAYRGVGVVFKDGRRFHVSRPVPVDYNAFTKVMEEIEAELVEKVKKGA